MQSVRGQTENHVADFHRLAADDPLALDHSDDESRQIVFAVRIKARHLGGLAADERAAVVLAGFGEAFDNFFRDFRLQLARREIVHEEQRRRALYGDVIDAMVDEVGANGVVNVHFERRLAAWCRRRPRWTPGSDRPLLFCRRRTARRSHRSR